MNVQVVKMERQGLVIADKINNQVVDLWMNQTVDVHNFTIVFGC